MEQLILLTRDELGLRLEKVKEQMRDNSCDAILIADNANKYYLTGRVFAGYIFISLQGNPAYAIQRPVELAGHDIFYIHKPENIPDHITCDITTIGLELDTLSYNTASRLLKLFPGATLKNASAMMRVARSIKTQEEVKMIAQSGICQERVYRRVPHLFHEGMTDLEFQIEIERTSRLEGCLGQFRISGDSMELFMGNIIAGENADAPSPYDFAMGGAGINPSLPVGANGTELRPGMTVMVDVNGNYTGYMTDMTRVFSIGHIDPKALKAHNCSIEIHRVIMEAGKPGTEAKTLYELAVEIARSNNLEAYFMGHRQHAGFIGHGVGIEINELPVIAPRSRDIIAPGQVIALEPKFVIPHVGAVGIENTYFINDDGQWQCLTNAPQEIISLD